MRVPVFHGLSPVDLIRPRRERTIFPFDAPEGMAFYRARNAIYYLFRALVERRRRLTVLVPDYNSGNEVLAIRAAGASIEYCPVGPDMRMDPDEVERLCDVQRPDVLYVIHYAGWPQPITTLVELCRRRHILLVEDCALALLSETDGRPLGSFGDWSVFCLYKTLPLPNGALLVRNSDREAPLAPIPLRSAGAPSTIGRTAELFVQRARMRAGAGGTALSTLKQAAGKVVSAVGIHRATVGDIGFDLSQVDLAMSRLSHRLLERIDFTSIRDRRTANLRALLSQLGDGISRPLPDPDPGVCPLFLPVLVPDKRAAARALATRGIEALEFWNDSIEPDGREMSPDARFLREHVLELPLHQDLTERHMTYMADCLSRLDLKVSHARHRILAA
jgi:dTDP-4-amino-4,6-dideoxygalactose transaminase